MPVMPLCSFREPTWYQMPKLTTGALRTSFVRHAEPVGQAGLPDPGGQRRVCRPGRRLTVDEPHAGHGQEEPEEDGKGSAASREPRAIH